MPVFATVLAAVTLTVGLHAYGQQELTLHTYFPSDFVPKISLRAIQYQRSARILHFSSTLWQAAGLWLFLATGMAAALGRRIRPTANSDAPSDQPPALLQVVGYYAVFTLIASVWKLPFDLGALLLERKYGFSTETLARFCSDELLRFLFGLIIAPAFWAGFLVVKRRPESWWIGTCAVLAPALLFLTVIEPEVIAPRFNHFTLLSDGNLKQQILQLANDAGLDHPQILVENTSLRTKHVNAYVTGIGPSARIVINDTAIQYLPEDQIVAMLGHEIGHYVEKHVLWNYVFSVLGLIIFMFACSRSIPWMVRRFPRWRIVSIFDLGMIPAISLLIAVFLFLQSPVECTISRFEEHRADAYGLRLTHRNEATARLMVGFAERDMTDPDPPALLQFWFGTHPTLKSRIDFALHFPAR